MNISPDKIMSLSADSQIWVRILLSIYLTQISDNYEGYSLDMFCLPKHYENDVESILIPKGLIIDR